MCSTRSSRWFRLSSTRTAECALHATLDRLSEDLRSWAQLLMEQDEALGVSPLDWMPSAAGRRPPNLFPGEASDEEVRRIVDEHLERLQQHPYAALATREDRGPQAVLARVQEGLLAHRKSLEEQ